MHSVCGRIQINVKVFSFNTQPMWQGFKKLQNQNCYATPSLRFKDILNLIISKVYSAFAEMPEKGFARCLPIPFHHLLSCTACQLAERKLLYVLTTKTSLTIWIYSMLWKMHSLGVVTKELAPLFARSCRYINISAYTILILHMTFWHAYIHFKCHILHANKIFSWMNRVLPL